MDGLYDVDDDYVVGGYWHNCSAGWVRVARGASIGDLELSWPEKPGWADYRFHC